MKMTYETHFAPREDGRYTATMAGFMQWLRDMKPEFALPEQQTKEEFLIWRDGLRKKAEEILLLPPFTEQPAPKFLSAKKREGYRVEKWEFYPDDYLAVPFLILIPDTATKDHPAPGVFCFPGSAASKELLAGEPLEHGIMGSFNKYPERNCMAKAMVQAGYVAFAFDNPATAETALPIERPGDFGAGARVHLCYGLAQCGMTYAGYSVFQKLCILPFLKNLPYVDASRLAVSAHSLGTIDANFLGLIRDEFQAVIINDFVGDDVERYFAVTEEDEYEMTQNVGNWHELFGIFRYFSRPEMCAALAPKYLALNEGGSEYHLARIQRAFDLMGVSDHLQISYYPKYQNEEDRIFHGKMPDHGISDEEYYQWHNVDAPDHSFRIEPSLRFLKKAFAEMGERK